MPMAGLIKDNAGNLCGRTYFGGGTGCKNTGHVGRGSVFKLAADGTESVLYAFHSMHGVHPHASLLKGPNGLLYGTATAGGTNNDGVIFSVKK